MKSLTVPRATYFVSSSVQARVRRPQDLFTALFGLGLFLWAVTANDTAAVDQLATVSPPWVMSLLRIGYLCLFEHDYVALYTLWGLLCKRPSSVQQRAWIATSWRWMQDGGQGRSGQDEEDQRRRALHAAAVRHREQDGYRS